MEPSGNEVKRDATARQRAWELRVRRRLDSHGYTLAKYRGRNPLNPLYGTYGVYDWYIEGVSERLPALHDGRSGYGLSLDAIERWLDDLEQS